MSAPQIQAHHGNVFAEFDKLIEAAPADPAAQVVPVSAGLVATMSSLQIAEITGKPHGNVMQDIRRILAEAEIDQQGFLSIFHDSYNRPQPCYHLPRRECDLVVSGYSVKYRLAIIDRWQELEAKQEQRDPMEILNDPAAMRGLLLGYTEKVLALETTVSELTPKADALDRIAGTDGLMNGTVAAKTLQIKPKALFTYLDTNGWTYRRPGTSERVPYQAKIMQGLMVMKAYRYTNEATGEDGLKESSYITPKGLAKLAEIFEKRGAVA
jgi:phage regulator Rha-like protein/phage antirepressor YoqD-like protein